MYKIIGILIVFVIGFFFLFQYPETGVVFFPLSGAFILGVYMLINAETAILFSILTLLGAFGIINQLQVLDRFHIAGGMVAMILAVIVVYRYESRKTVFQKEYTDEIRLLESEIQQLDGEKSYRQTTINSLDMRGVLQKRMESIVRELAGTLDPVVIRKQMFALVNEIIPEGKKYLISGSAHLDPADEWVMRQRVPILSRDVSTDGRFISKSMHNNVKSLIVAPIVIQGRVEDILRIESEEKNAFDLTDLRIVELITLMTSVSLGNARLYIMAETRAINDGLTELLTQNYFIEKLQHELLFAHRYKTSTALIMIDVDHFKAINDTHGHQVGDAVLKHLGAILRDTAHPIGSAARYGGEEFAILFPQTGRTRAKDIGTHILKAIQQASFDSEEYKGIQVTVSMGIAVFPEDGSNVSQLLGVADSNLYRAKASGRNRLIG